MLGRRTQIKRGKAMRRRSEKGRSRIILRADLVRRVLAERPLCEWPGCRERAVDVHEPHTRGRGGSDLDVSNVRACCRAHHDIAHLTPRHAERIGWLVSGGPARKREMTDAHWHVREIVRDYPRDQGRPARVEDIVSIYAEAHLLLGDLVDAGQVTVDRDGALAAVRVGMFGRFDDGAGGEP